MCFPVYLFYVKVNIGVNECANTVDNNNGGMTDSIDGCRETLVRRARGARKQKPRQMNIADSLIFASDSSMSFLGARK
jgi:hypothetical protein